MTSKKRSPARLPVVAIVGRPNVGKSTLFNRIIGQRKAIVNDRPGVTRDRLYGVVKDFECPFFLVDTGGMVPGEESNMDIQSQVRAAINEADLLIFVLDAQSGIVSLDQEVANVVRRTNKPVIFVANKVDSQGHLDKTGALYEIGAEDIMPVSAEHNRGILDLVEKVCEGLPKMKELEEEEDIIRVAIIGKPNVGKSTLVNRLANDQRIVVSDEPGTTRDAIDVEVEINGRKYRFVDTAGIRRRSKVHDSVEFFSVMRAIKSIEEAEVVVLMMDALDPATDQDKRLAGLVLDRGRGLILGLNKFDLAKGTPTALSAPVTLRENFFFAQYAPIVRVSAKTGMNVHKLIKAINTVYENLSLRVPTHKLNEFLHEVIERHPPPSKGSKRVKVLYITQVRTAPPVIAAFCNYPNALSEQYKRYIISHFREHFGFEGVPIKLILKSRKKVEKK